MFRRVVILAGLGALLLHGNLSTPAPAARDDSSSLDLWTAVIENVAVILGAYDYFAYADYYTFGGKTIEGYGGWFSWALFVPLGICLGWFLLSLPALVFSIRLLGEKRARGVVRAVHGIEDPEPADRPRQPVTKRRIP